MKLTTKRLILRDIKKSDANSIRKSINNLNVSKYLLAVPYPYTKENAEWWVNHCAERQKEKPKTSYELGITIKPSDKIVGGIGLSKVNKKEKTAGVGYWISERYWRKGYVSEAVKKIIEFAFNKLKLKELIIPVFVENTGSNALAKKVGGKFIKRKKKACIAKSTGKTHDENIYKITKGETK